MNLSLYKPSDLELWIVQAYRNNGIHYASDMDIDHIASIYNVVIRTTNEETRALWDDSFGVILLNARYKNEQRREAFFHELGHCLRHVGCQHHMPDLFRELQEVQASQFQLYAAMPIYMIEQFMNDVYSWEAFEKNLSEAFVLPLPFVHKRIEQIKNRIYLAERDNERRERVIDTSYITPEYVKQRQIEIERQRKERFRA